MFFRIWNNLLINYKVIQKYECYKTIFHILIQSWKHSSVIHFWSHYCLASRKSFNNLHKSRFVVFRAHRGLHIVSTSRNGSISSSSSSSSRRVYRLGSFFIGIVVKVDNRASTWSWSRVCCVRVQVTSNLMSILVLNVLSCPAIHLLLFRLSPTLPQPPPPAWA